MFQCRVFISYNTLRIYYFIYSLPQHCQFLVIKFILQVSKQSSSNSHSSAGIQTSALLAARTWSTLTQLHVALLEQMWEEQGREQGMEESGAKRRNRRRSKEEKKSRNGGEEQGKAGKEREKEGAENLYLSDGGIKENTNQLRQGVAGYGDNAKSIVQNPLNSKTWNVHSTKIYRERHRFCGCPWLEVLE